MTFNILDDCVGFASEALHDHAKKLGIRCWIENFPFNGKKDSVWLRFELPCDDLRYREEIVRVYKKAFKTRMNAYWSSL